MKDLPRLDRRSFLRLGLTTAASIPAALLLPQGLLAADSPLPLVDEQDPSAVALGYVHDASQVDTGKFPKRTGDAGASQFCHNCALYQGEGTDGVGGCSIFPGKNVKAGGWCNAWVAKPE